MSGRERRRVERRIGIAFLVSSAASIGLTIVFVAGGQPQAEGALLGLALGALGVGFVVWARRLMPQEAVDERHVHASDPGELAAVEEQVVRPAARVDRRGFLGGSLLAAIVALGAAAVLPVRSLGPRPGKALFQTAWRAGSRVVDQQGRVLRVGDLRMGGIVTVFPEGHVGSADSQTVLIRFDPGELDAPLPGGEERAPRGHIAYSKVCTHLGCPVGLYQTDPQRLFCPCEQSAFAVLEGARPLSGPATRPLPQLPLMVDDEGFLRARGDFPEPVGPGFWNRA